MKLLFLRFFILVNSLIIAQTKDGIAIKIYLEDAESGNNIKGAKVTLEGFEIPEIVGKYDKKGRFYYFTKIPAGYNTVMAYHKKYNEKGFQDVDGLPQEMKLRLKKRENNFLILPEDFYSDEKKELMVKYNYREYYIEDPFKIVINTDIEMNYEQKRQYLISLIKDQNLDIEMVNPFFEKDKMSYNVDYNIFNNYLKVQNEAYPKALAYNSNGMMQAYQIFPLFTGMNTMDDFFKAKNSKEICFIFRKTNGKKFKRFNDPIIEKIKELKLDVCTIVLYKNVKSWSPDHSIKNKIRDRLNNGFNTKYAIDSSKIFFYDNQIRNKTKSRIRKENRSFKMIDLDLSMTVPSFILIKNDSFYISNSYLFEMNYNTFFYSKQYEQDFYKYKVKLVIPKQYNSIGLGLLDQYEYYANKQY